MKREDIREQPHIVLKCGLVGVTRCLDNLGRVVIPMEYRETLGMATGQEVEIFLTTEGVYLKPVKDTDDKPKHE